MTTGTPQARAGPAAAGKRERNKAENRAAILLAAREVFAELGYGAATVRDVIRRTDLAAGTFYNYFPDKEAVLRALVEQSAEEVRPRLREVRAGASDLEGWLHAGFTVYFQWVVQEPAMFELMRRNAGTIRSLVEQPALGAGIDELEEDVRLAVEAGHLSPIDSEYVTAAMSGVAFEIGVRMVEREPVDVEGAAAFATALFLGGIERLSAR